MNIPEGPTSVDRDEQAARWCVRLEEDDWSSDERGAFDRWIADEANAAALEDSVRTWRGLEIATDMPDVVGMRSAALEDFRWVTGRQSLPRRRGLLFGSMATAMLAAVVMFAAFLYDPGRAFATGIAERRIAMLEDGSRLSLDADSRVDVRLRSDRREVKMIRGRAQFVVAHDPDRPFSVTAGDKVIVATGTSFGVEIIGGQVRVVLYDGHVTVGDRAAGTRVPLRDAGNGRVVADDMLTPGRELVTALTGPSPAIVVPANLIHAASWEVGQLDFDDEPLATAVIRMNRYTTRALTIGDAAARGVKVDGVFAAGDVAAFVEGVTTLYPLQADERRNAIILHSSQSK